MTTLKADSVTVEARLPRRLLAEIQAFVDEGRYKDLDDVVLDALRRHVESHRDSLHEKFLREDVEWGLRGGD